MVYDLAVFMHAEVERLDRDHPDEKWGITSKLKTASSDSVFYVSFAIANQNTDGNSQYDWASAKRNLFAMQSIYTLAGKQKLLKVNPTIFISIDEALSKINHALTICTEEKQAHIDQEMSLWLKKYDIWKQIQQNKSATD